MGVPVRRTVEVSTIEWATVGLIAACHSIWLAAGLLFAAMPLLAIVLLALTIVLHSSLQHEAIHGHPTRSAGLNAAMVALPLGLIVPYRRFREQHLMHHVDSRLTDPYDDPESYYLAYRDWDRLPRVLQRLLALNNTLAVRMAIGPAVSTAIFVWNEAKTAAGSGKQARAVRLAWTHHAVGLVAVCLIVHFVFAMPLGVYVLSAYVARSVLAVRSFCEHRWADRPEGRTVIVEKSLLGWLFLNNNLHFVHHTQPGLPWYALPRAYRERREEWQAMNDGYVFCGYGAVLWRFGLRIKEQVPHPVRARR